RIVIQAVRIDDATELQATLRIVVAKAPIERRVFAMQSKVFFDACERPIVSLQGFLARFIVPQLADTGFLAVLVEAFDMRLGADVGQRHVANLHGRESHSYLLLRRLRRISQSSTTGEAPPFEACIDMIKAAIVLESEALWPMLA